MNKKAFTLIELTLVIVIVGILYSLVFTDFLKPKQKKVLKVESLKNYIHKLEYKNKSRFICLQDSNECLIFLDNIFHSSIKNPFGNIVGVYKLDKNRTPIYFRDIEIDGSFKTILLNFFMYRNMTHNNLIIESEEKVFLLDSGYKDILTFDSISDYIDFKNEILAEVKNAF